MNYFFYIRNDVVKENYLWIDDLHLTNKFIIYSNGTKNNSILLMTKGCDLEENIDIKENLVQVSKERCSISQKLTFNSNSSIKKSAECIIELTKVKINNIKKLL